MKGIVLLLLVAAAFSSLNAAEAEPPWREGYWLYGFEQSLFETCDGRLYWIWVPQGFSGVYSMEGYRNPVRVRGRILAPNPEQNMHSMLHELQPAAMAHYPLACRSQ